MSLELSNFLEINKDRLSPLLILMHDYPDPDALASAYSLQYLAELKGGIRSRIVYGAVIGRIENQEMVRLLKIPVYKSAHRIFAGSPALLLSIPSRVSKITRFRLTANQRSSSTSMS